MVDVLGRGVYIDLHPVDLAVEFIPGRPVVGGDWLARVTAHLRGLVHRKQERMGTRDATLANLCAVYVERDGATLAPASAVVRELHTRLMLSRRQRRSRLDLEVLEAEKVVVVLQVAVEDVEAPAAHVSALRDDDATGAGRRHLDLRGDRVRLVLRVDDR